MQNKQNNPKPSFIERAEIEILIDFELREGNR
jgi:hypothetical protein